MKTRSFVFGLLFLFFISASTATAQDPVIIRMGYFDSNLPLESLKVIGDTEDYDFLEHPPNLMTDYFAINAGQISLEYAFTGSETIRNTIDLEAGQQYSVIKMSYDAIPLIINETEVR